MTITTTVIDNTGTSRANVYFYPKLNTSSMLIDGVVKATLVCFVSESAKDAGASQIFLTKDGEIVSECSFTLDMADVVKSGAGCTVADVATFFYGHVETALESLTGWSVNQ